MARILTLSPDLSGNATWTPYQLGGALSRRYRVDLAGPASGDLWAPLRGEVEPVAVLPGFHPLSGRVRRAMSALARGYDLLYAFKAMPASLGVGLWASRRLGVPLALHLDDWDAGFFADRPWTRRAWYALRSVASPEGSGWLSAVERLIPRADALTVASSALRRRFGGTVVRQGVDTARFSPERFPREQARRRIGVDPDRFLVLSLGTPRLHKGLAVLARMAAAHPGDLHLVVGVEGGGAGELPTGGVELRAPVPYAEAAWYLGAADVLVVPQRPVPYAVHQTPAKILHAMALGVPVVTTDVGDARELVEARPHGPAAGIVVPPEDPAALSEALGHLRERPSERDAMAREARRRAVAELGWRAMEARLGGVLGPLLDGGAG